MIGIASLRKCSIGVPLSLLCREPNPKRGHSGQTGLKLYRLLTVEMLMTNAPILRLPHLSP